MTGVIYKYESPSGKLYIGQTSREKIRHLEFLDISKSYAGNAIQYARKKYGPESFKYEILVTLNADTKTALKKELDFWERYYITFYKDLGYELYNLTSGGDCGCVGYHHTADSKAKISKGNIGKKRTEETRAKMRESQKGKHGGPRPKEWYINRKRCFGGSNVWLKKPVKSIDPATGEVVKIYDSIKEAAADVGVNESAIRKVFAGTCKTIKGLMWEKL